MSHYFVRVELHHYPAESDYQNLHAQLAQRGYFRVIWSAEFGHWYDLPRGEYYKESNNLFSTEDDLVTQALDSVKNTSSNVTEATYVLTRSPSKSDFNWRLFPTTDANKLPAGARLT